MFNQSDCDARIIGARCNKNNPTSKSTQGFTLIELMMVVAIVAILLSIALPAYSNYSIRAKIAEGLGVAAAAKTAASAVCQEFPNLNPLTNSAAGYSPSSGTESAYVSSIALSGDCAIPLITITTRNTGTDGYDPIIQVTGSVIMGSGRVTWVCASSNTPSHLLPATCRS